MQNSALLIFSGGQDSGTCLAWALEHFDLVHTIGFNYGQRHAVEMQCRQKVREHVAALKPEWAQRLGADYVLKTDFFEHIEANALTGNVAIEDSADKELPNTFVPGRNLIFLNLASAWAYDKNIRHMVMGVCETDSSGYPDCRDNSIKAMQVALNLGMDKDYIIHTPLMWINKADTWHLAEHLGGQALVEVLLEYSHTCYKGERKQRHAWGYGCTACPACVLRAKGFAAYKANANV